MLKEKLNQNSIIRMRLIKNVKDINTIDYTFN